MTLLAMGARGRVAPAPSGDPLAEFWDWRTETGTSNSALSDGGKITSPVRGSLNLMTVAPTSGDSGWPAALANYVALNYDTNGTDGRTWQIGTENLDRFPLPAVGASQWRRWYWKNDLPDGANVDTDHGFESNIGTIQITARNRSGSAGSAIFDWVSTLETLRAEALVPKGVVYRVEMELLRFSTTEWRLSVWLYDEAVSLTVPVFSPEDFVGHTDPAQNLTTMLWSYDDARALFRNWLFGASGQSGATYVGVGVKFGAFAVSMDGPIGAYPVAGSGEAA